MLGLVLWIVCGCCDYCGSCGLGLGLFLVWLCFWCIILVAVFGYGLVVLLFRFNSVGMVRCCLSLHCGLVLCISFS